MQSIASVLAVFFAGCGLLVVALRWWRPEVSWRAAAGYVALTTAFFAQPLFTGALQIPTDIAYLRLPFSDMVSGAVAPLNPLLADTLLEQLPFHALVRERLLAGEAPLWAHELGTGQPLLGNCQSAPFAPLHLLALPVATARALTVAGAWQILLGLLLTHALLLRLGAGSWGAALGAVASGLSAYAVVWIYDTPGMAAAWVPGILLGILLARDAAPRALAGLTVCALGLALSGHPESMAHAGLVATVLAVALWFRPHPDRWRFVARLAVPALLAAALAAPALLPVLEVIPDSVRGRALAESAENFQPPPFEGRFLLPVVAPLALGNPRDGSYDMEWSFSEMCSHYAGLLTVVVAVAGALVLRRRPLWLLAAGLLALLVALRVSPFFDLMLHLPVVGEAAHGRLREYWVLGVALAAGLVLERVAGDRVLRTVTVALLGLAVVGVLLAPMPGPSLWFKAWWWMTLAGTVAAAIALLVPGLRPRFAPLVVAAVAVDLFLVGVRYQPVMPARFDLSPPAAVSYLQEQERSAPTPFRASAEGLEFPPNLGALYGVWDPRGYDPMRPDDAARFVGNRLGLQHHFRQIVRDSRLIPPQSTFDYLAVRFRITAKDRSMPAPWRRAFENAGAVVWENPGALPLFFMPGQLQTFAQPAKVQSAALHGGDLAAVGFVVGRPRSLVAQDGEVRGIEPRSNGFVMQVESRTGGMVASSVSYLPAWESTVDGRPARVAEVNSGFLGVRVPPGSHTVELRYRPRGWRIGLWLFAVGLFASGLLWLGRRRGWSSLAWVVQ